MLEIHNPDDGSRYDGTAFLTEIRQASVLLRKAVAYSAKDTKTCFCISKYGFYAVVTLWKASAVRNLPTWQVAHLCRLAIFLSTCLFRDAANVSEKRFPWEHSHRRELGLFATSKNKNNIY